MADPYTLGLTASQIDTALSRAHNSDNAPAAGSSNLVTSDKIYESDQNILAQSKSYTDNEILAAPLSQAYESPEFDIPNAGVLVSFSHGLPSVPKIMQIVARCKVTKVGYNVGDEILIGDYGDAGQTQSLWANSTTIGWGHMYSGSTIIIKEKTGDLYEKITSPNFKLVIRAYA